ncbi:hypothetical protein C7271_08580 [filamentous cyanobacterium CCP5]|nr:hypothetical protein C7271_08580 [filamentous cyanobacterium CCP5]
MNQTMPRFQLPVIATACLILFLGYVLFTTGYESLTCERVSPGSVQCEAVESYLFGLFARSQDAFTLEDVQVNSELRDRNPTGGVRFSHTLVLQGEHHQFTSDPFRSPLSEAAIRKQIQQFIRGEGPIMLNFQRSTQLAALIRSSLLALLLAIVSWSFWDVRWPPAPVSAEEDVV